MTEIEKQIQSLVIAVVKMEKTQEATIKGQDATTKNVDKLTELMEDMLPFHTEIANLKNTVYGMIVIAIGFGIWITTEHYKLKELLGTHLAVQVEKEKKLQDDLKKNNEKFSQERNDNKNQITYLKGRIK